MKHLVLLLSLVGPLLVAAGCSRGSDERPPLVCLISVDTLRADHLGTYGSDRGLTPRLDALAAESVVFERAYAPASFTVPSMSTVHTSLYPEENAVLINEHRLHDDVPTLAEAFRAAGYRTGAVVSNYVLRAASGLDRGFERFDDRQPQHEVARGLPERIATGTTDDALALVDALGGGKAPLFLWVHYQDPHGPYTPPAELVPPLLELERARPGGDRRLPFGKDHRGLDGIPTYQRLGDGTNEVAQYLARYDAEIRFTDQEIGRLLDGLEARGLLAEGVVAFVADHGEGLGEDGYWFAHGEYLSDPLTRVPFLLRAPGHAPGRRGEPVGLVDVLPTLLPLAGLASPAAIRGVDLFAGPRTGALYQASLGGSTVLRFGIIEGDRQYVVELDEERRPARQHLRALGPGGEDLLTREPRRAAALNARLVELQRSLVRTRQPILGAVDAHTADMLKGLGYTEGADEDE